MTKEDVQRTYDGAGRVSVVHMFGSDGLRVNGRVFTMFVGDDMVAKVPARRATELVDAGLADRFDPGHGRVMREWVRVTPESRLEWRELASEAYAYVGRLSDRRRPSR